MLIATSLTSIVAQGQTLQQCIKDMTAEIKQEQYGTKKRCDMEEKYNATIISGENIAGTPHDRQYTIEKWEDIEADRQRYCMRRIDALDAQLKLVPQICKTKRTKATFPETIIISAKGNTVESSGILEKGKHYKIVIEGTYIYQSPGSIGDAQYYWKKEKKFSDKAVLFNGKALKASIFDIGKHKYTFNIDGMGRVLALKLRDKNYEDNSGGLKATIYFAER